MAKEFLERHSDWEKSLEMENHVIIEKADYEALEQALAFGRIKEMDGVVYSNTNFEFQLEQCVNRVLSPAEKELDEDEQETILFQGVIKGRIEWQGRENDYIVLLRDTDKVRQVPESMLQKCKKQKD